MSSVALLISKNFATLHHDFPPLFPTIPITTHPKPMFLWCFSIPNPHQSGIHGSPRLLRSMQSAMSAARLKRKAIKCHVFSFACGCRDSATSGSWSFRKPHTCAFSRALALSFAQETNLQLGYVRPPLRSLCHVQNTAVLSLMSRCSPPKSRISCSSRPQQKYFPWNRLLLPKPRQCLPMSLRSLLSLPNPKDMR